MQFNPIVSGSKNISILGELKLLEGIRSPRTTFKDLAFQYNGPKTSIVRSFDEHIDIKPHRLTKIICFDQINAKKLTETKYSFVIT